MSLWPSVMKGSGSIFGAGIAPLFHTYEQDIDGLGEGREPDIVIDLYSLNADAATTEFNKLVNDPSQLRYVVFAGMSRKDQAANCVRFAADILKVAGINNLQPKFGLSQASSAASILTPELFADYIQSAKQKELRDFPETKQFDPSYQEQRAKQGWCSIL